MRNTTSRRTSLTVSVGLSPWPPYRWWLQQLIEVVGAPDHLPRGIHYRQPDPDHDSDFSSGGHHQWLRFDFPGQLH